MNLAGFGKGFGIVRHQLLIHEDIGYTSSNSSYSIQVNCCNPEGLINFCRNFLEREGVSESNSGFCVISESLVPEEVEEWGRRAKREILTMEEALSISKNCEILLEGVFGNHRGIIGAMAAVGLRKTGNDGRFIWQLGKQLKDLRGTMTVEELKNGTQVDEIISKEGKVLEPQEMIDLTDWLRSVLINGKTFLIAERNLKRSGSYWKIADKEYIRKIGS
jgi:hypothetical protein